MNCISLERLRVYIQVHDWSDSQTMFGMVGNTWMCLKKDEVIFPITYVKGYRTPNFSLCFSRAWYCV